MKRYCQTLELMDDPDMIRRYCDVHKHVWPEMGEGLGAFGRDAPPSSTISIPNPQPPD